MCLALDSGSLVFRREWHGRLARVSVARFTRAGRPCHYLGSAMAAAISFASVCRAPTAGRPQAESLWFRNVNSVWSWWSSGAPRFGLDAARTEIHRRRVLRSLLVSLCLAALLRAMADPAAAPPDEFANDADFLEFLQRKAFDYFWLEANPANGLIRDRSRTHSYCSIAAVVLG